MKLSGSIPYTIAIAAICFQFTAQAEAFTPQVDQQSRWIEVTGIERLDSCTRVSVTLKNYPRWWDKVADSGYLIQPGDTTVKYRLTGEENIPLNTRIHMPDSGRHDGTLIFEAIPDGISVLDYVEDAADPRPTVWGIHLDREADGTVPDFINAADYFYKSHSPADQWTGLSRYDDIPRYDLQGKVHLRGKIHDYSPRAGANTFTVRTTDQPTGNQRMNLVEISPDGSFESDIEVMHPQYAYMQGAATGKLFLIPGDTLECVTTTLSSFDTRHNRPVAYFGFRGDPSADIIAINALTDTVSDRYGLERLFEQRPAGVDSLESVLIKENDRLYTLLDSVMTDLPRFIGQLPVSHFAKDILASMAMSSIIERAETNEMYFSFNHTPTMMAPDSINGGFTFDRPYDIPDLETMMSPRRRYIDLIYDNPILICCNYIISNRWEFGYLFSAARCAATGALYPSLVAEYETEGKSSYRLLSEIFADRQRTAGVGNCFAAQLSCVRNLIGNIGSQYRPDRPDMDKASEYVGNLMCFISYPNLSKALTKAYSDYVEEVVKAEVPVQNTSTAVRLDSSAEADVLKEIISPYTGNVLYLDFWGMNCGPCRAGMRSQKELVEKFAADPFRMLYIAEDSGNKASAEKWMEKEGIKGEHIFVSPDNWNRLRALFNFDGIPFGVLIGKNGGILQTGFSWWVHGKDEDLIRRALEER